MFLVQPLERNLTAASACLFRALQEAKSINSHIMSHKSYHGFESEDAYPFDEVQTLQT